MPTIKRGLIYLLRKRGRSILLLVITFIMAIFAMLGFAIMSSANNERDALLRSLAGGFELKANIDNEALWEFREGEEYKVYTGEYITQKMIDEIVEIESVTDYFTIQTIQGMWVNIALRPGFHADELEYLKENPDILNQPPAYDTLDYYIVSKQCPDLYGCTETEKHAFFRNGSISLVEGRHIGRDDYRKILISTYLAELNGLSVGDTIITEGRRGSYKGGENNGLFNGPVYEVMGEPIELEVVGIFDPNFSQPSWNDYMYRFESQLIENIIYCDLNISAEIYTLLVENGIGVGPNKNSRAYETATFFVDDSSRVEEIMQAAKQIEWVDEVFFAVKADDSAFRATERPLKQMSSVSILLMTIIIISCVGLLALVLNMWIKSRKREMGIYMSLGLSKKTIIGQLIIECMIIAVIALVLAFIVSSILAGPVGHLIETMVSPDDYSNTYVVEFDLFFIPKIEKALADPIALDYYLSATNILLVALIILGSIIVSVLFSARKIMKLKPKSVLSTL